MGKINFRALLLVAGLILGLGLVFFVKHRADDAYERLSQAKPADSAAAPQRSP